MRLRGLYRSHRPLLRRTGSANRSSNSGCSAVLLNAANRCPQSFERNLTWRVCRPHQDLVDRLRAEGDPSRMAQTTSDWPRRMSPAENTLGARSGSRPCWRGHCLAGRDRCRAFLAAPRARDARNPSRAARARRRGRTRCRAAAGDAGMCDEKLAAARFASVMRAASRARRSPTFQGSRCCSGASLTNRSKRKGFDSIRAAQRRVRTQAPCPMHHNRQQWRTNV